MTLAHMVYVPFVLVVGLAVGWALGARAAREEHKRAEARKRRAEAE